MNAARSRVAASQISLIGLAVSGAYERYSWTPKPSLPLLATKQGWPSVMPVSISWKEPSRAREAAVTGFLASL